MADILCQVVSVEKVDDIMAQNKPNKKLEFQIRDARQVQHCFQLILWPLAIFIKQVVLKSFIIIL